MVGWIGPFVAPAARERPALRALQSDMLRILRYTWPLPWTLVGLSVAGLVRLLGGRWQCRSGALEAHGGWLAWLCQRLPAVVQFDAITLGHVIIGRDARTLDVVRAHEHVHLRQYERWGALFVPAYLGASLWQWVRGARPYRDNPFEREAYASAPMRTAPPVCANTMKVE